MFPVDLHNLGCDTYSASLHKWFLGPIGTGFFYVRRGARDRIRSIFAHDATPQAPAFGPPGTVDLPVRAGIGTALDMIETIGADQVEVRTRYLSDYLKTRLSEMPDVTLVSGPTPGTSCPGSTIFEMEGVDAVASVGLMEERIRTHIDEHQRDGHNAIRVSTHIYNTKAEIDRLIEGLVSLRG
jgi:selenocysteine lyase/cysteine desulfurase